MGNCNSFESTAVSSTAKLILQDGKLQEFSRPVKVSHVLQKNPASFICNADEIDFDNFVSAINADEELHPGQLYFALPLSRLKHPIQAEEMAALAVKASSALMRSHGEKSAGQRRKDVAPVSFSGYERNILRGENGGDRGMTGKRRRKRLGRGNDFISKLSAIEE